MMLVAMTFVPVVGVLSHYIGLVGSRIEASTMPHWRKMFGRWFGTASHFRMVKAYRGETYENRFFRNELMSMRDIRRREERLEYAFKAGKATVSKLAVIVLFAVGMHWLNRGISWGNLVACSVYVGLLFEPISRLTEAYEGVTKNSPHLETFFELMDAVPSVTDKKGAIQLVRVQGNIVFNSVSFQYAADRELALRNVKFTLQAGQKVVLVGANGSGKSTILNLLLRLYDPLEGSIAIDGIPLTDVTQDSLRRQFGMVTPDCAPFNDTITANICYGRGEASKEEVLRAARIARIDSFIGSLPDGYETVIAETPELSSGQIQRILIARAVFSDPPVILLDESTTNVDPESASLIMESIEELSRVERKTVIICSHQLSMIHSADLILVMEGGQIVGQGTHANLLESCESYRRLVESFNNGRPLLADRSPEAVAS
jgi:ATP-binding cassette subfamily B protein